MKNPIVLVLSGLLLVAGCGQKETTLKIQKNSPQYTFFKELSQRVPLLDPDKNVLLVETTAFKVTTSNFLPELYYLMGGDIEGTRNATAEQIINFVKQSAERTAEERLLLSAARKSNIQVSEDTLEAILSSIYARYGGEQQFEQKIATRNMILAYVRNDVKEDLTIQKYLDTVVFANITITDEQIADYYKQDKLATVQHILLLTQRKSEQEKAQIRKKMEDILARARAGEDFGKLAEQYSEDPGSRAKGGLYSDFPRGQMVKPFEDAAFNLPIGSISDIVETRYGFHILKILGRKAETRPLEEVRDEIIKQLTQSEKQAAYTKHLEELKTEYKFKVVELG
ncbi:MAG: peptidylprolyl isomerase [candidate division KSB1 bacterium]|nr:peptidylprolyl isomerase [candidate division KSB1 bacterium]